MRQNKYTARHAASPLGRAIRVLVYVMLALTAGVTMLFSDRLWNAFREGSLPVWAPLLAPAIFTAFVAVYTVDRWFLVRWRSYPLSRAFFQVAFALVFLTLLLPQQASEMRVPRRISNPEQPALQLLSYPDEAVRSAACSMLSGPPTPEVYNRVTDMAHGDPSPNVREQCGQALERLHAAAWAEPGAH